MIKLKRVYEEKAQNDGLRYPRTRTGGGRARGIKSNELFTKVEQRRDMNPMNADSQAHMVSREGPWPASAEERLSGLGIKLPAPPQPFGTYVEAVQTGNLLFLSGMLPTEDHAVKFIGRVGAELDVEAGRKAAHLAALNGLAVAASIWDRSTKWRGSSGWACQWRLRGTSAISQKLLTALRSCCKTYSEKTRTPLAWCMGSPAFRLGPLSHWKLSSR